MSDNHLIKLNLIVTDEDIDNTLDTGFHAGIAYWCELLDYRDELPEGATAISEVVSRGQSVYLTDDESVVHELNKEKVLKGFELWATENKTIDLSDIDSVQADSIIQYALFGKQVYA